MPRDPCTSSAPRDTRAAPPSSICVRSAWRRTRSSAHATCAATTTRAGPNRGRVRPTSTGRTRSRRRCVARARSILILEDPDTGPAERLRHGQNLVDAAAQAGVGHVVFAAATGPDHHRLSCDVSSEIARYVEQLRRAGDHPAAGDVHGGGAVVLAQPVRPGTRAHHAVRAVGASAAGGPGRHGRARGAGGDAVRTSSSGARSTWPETRARHSTSPGCSPPASESPCGTKRSRSRACSSTRRPRPRSTTSAVCASCIRGCTRSRAGSRPAAGSRSAARRSVPGRSGSASGGVSRAGERAAAVRRQSTRTRAK